LPLYFVVAVVFNALIKLMAEKSHQIKTTETKLLQNGNLLQSAPLDPTSSCGAIAVYHNCGLTTVDTRNISWTYPLFMLVKYIKVL